MGEPKELVHQILESTIPLLPEEKPRHLLGVGSPEDLWECVARGIDIFDCALPTRLARNGALFTRQGRINIRRAQYASDPAVVEEGCDCYLCRTFSRAYLRHLFVAEEILGLRLATLHNLRFIFRLMQEIRQSIVEGRFPTAKEDFLAQFKTADYERRGARLRQVSPQEPWTSQRP